jgi:NAD+ kinase
MAATFRTVGLIGKSDADRIVETLAEIRDLLLRRGIRVILESQAAEILGADRLEVGTAARIGETSDLAIVVGGDGTLLTAARNLADYDIPLVGVNLGRLGFLVDISPGDLAATLTAMLDGVYRTEDRYMLRATILRGGTAIRQQRAVNEVVVRSGNPASMIEIETRIDGVFLNSQRSDGLIVSTPTGSTAYALSAGGPILSPRLRSLVLAPINPHTLTNRPIVLDDSSVIDISFRPSKQFKAQVVCDNMSIPDVEITDGIEIRKEPKPFRILHPVNHDFFEILRAKLNWSSGYRC